jgi:hypothetical protein
VIAGRWFVTPHSVRRYIERVDRRATYEQALAALVSFSERARRVREISPGVWLYRGPRPQKLRFRVAEGGAGLPQLLTVMGGHDKWWTRQ